MNSNAELVPSDAVLQSLQIMASFNIVYMLSGDVNVKDLVSKLTVELRSLDLNIPEGGLCFPELRYRQEAFCMAQRGRKELHKSAWSRWQRPGARIAEHLVICTINLKLFIDDHQKCQ